MGLDRVPAPPPELIRKDGRPFPCHVQPQARQTGTACLWLFVPL